jgi:hypothetical protein
MAVKRFGQWLQAKNGFFVHVFCFERCCVATAYAAFWPVFREIALALG